MKTKPIALALLASLALALSAFAGPGHSHEKKEAGPNGGRLLTKLDPHAEFLVLPDRKIQITFLDEANKPTAPAAQVVTVTTGDRAAPTKLTFTKTETALVSDAPVPAGNSLPTVVQIKVTPDAKTIVEKFNLNLSVCPGCSLAEYACTCGH